MNIQLSEQALTNLKSFLKRVQLTGAEVPAFVEIEMQLNLPQIKECEKDISKPIFIEAK